MLELQCSDSVWGLQRAEQEAQKAAEAAERQRREEEAAAERERNRQAAEAAKEAAAREEADRKAEEERQREEHRLAEIAKMEVRRGMCCWTRGPGAPCRGWQLEIGSLITT